MSRDSALHAAFFAPRSIAVVGASDDETKTAGRPLAYLRRAGYEGAIYPVNPRRDTVLGEKAWPSLQDLPEQVDHAFILTGADAAVEAVAECAARGVKVATVLANGFSEAGAVGQARVDRMLEAAGGTGLRILGPSSLGVVNLHGKMALTANAAFAEEGLPKGNIFVASHSGSMIGALLSRGKSLGVGFAGLVSVGNELDLSLGELCQATLDDPEVGGYLLFLESLRKAEDIRRFASLAHQRGKPIVALKLGRSPQAAELALSHTGALAGEDAVADAFFRDCGIARVETLEGLLGALPLLARTQPASRQAQVGMVTTTGGGAAMVVDQLGVRGITVEEPKQETYDAFKAHGVEVDKGRIVDLTLAGVRPEIMKAALSTMVESKQFDLVVAVVGSSARNHPELAVKPILEVAGRDVPLAVFLVPDAPEALKLLAKEGIPVFRSPEACADVVAAALKRGRPKPQAAAGAALTGAVRNLDEWEAYQVLSALGVMHAPVCRLDKGNVPETLPITYPVVAKVLSPHVLHKTDIGGVVLGIADRDGLQHAAEEIGRRVTQKIPQAAGCDILVQAMVRGLGEALVGYRIDPEVGPIVMVASGGVMTEIYQDRAIRLAPVDLETAREMIDDVRAFKALKGFRGKPAGDLEALAAAVVAMSSLAERPELGIREAEVNPFLILREGDGVVAVDALMQASKIEPKE
ncbi:6-carboxyhexanoate--CoA ligase [Rhizobium wuzhouense]|uniref:6-carboxyhexanoate--CoA ligase n=2 Tax=Rhizobium wuzhouense TaxID=1986026 RepID=A0ABX5NPY4_9HYPH|nr:6-carboxyhexanoate--CoA ligase [Rhizobium wuzhouense]